jgi:transcription-repair coupling factor (superfamily II helicase)
VGERFRALDVLAAGGLVCASAAALVEGMPPAALRSEALTLRAGEEPGVDGLAASLALGGYERVDRVEERGQFAVRGGIVDVFPSTGREPLRVELFGDEIEQVRAFSPFTQRALSTVDHAVVYPAAERRADAREVTLRDEEAEASRLGPRDLVPPLDRVPDLVWQPDDVRRVWDEEGLSPLELDGVAELDPFPRGQAFAFEAQRPALAARGLAEAENELAGFVRAGLRVVVAFHHRGEALRQQALLRRVGAELHEAGQPLPDEPGVRFAVAPARRGFVWRELGVALLPDVQVFRKRPPRADARLGRALASFAELRVSDFVVHEDHGVGRLLGFETKEVAGVTRDYLFLAFRGEDRLYVPHEQIGKVSRYVGADASTPALSKLGGRAWNNLKSRARESVRELAGELLQLYAQRQRAEGVALDVSGEWLEQLEASFPYRETDDQTRAIEAVKEDLEAPHPMDRLVCGDVGFGKTEVAVRAAFAAATNGKQVLVLCPTTILAEQHWNTFRERYRDFPVRVEMISRFVAPSAAKKLLQEFAAGKIEVLVGTHRILSRDVIPKDLGLVVVDEEQRFGVAQKELLRALRLEVDVLALSATPIPRTLHMSLSGLRDISIIETPPEGRRPIRTAVGEYDEELIRVALEREQARGGQSFYLHNRVETIDEAAVKLQQLCPELRILVAHGQMAERELEERMHTFLAGDADVLVSTTIIESGIDIPQANTLVVERADALGLAQLYQIRGRVGRSDVTAHAYLFYPSASELTPEARARLATLADHTELGAGFQIAMRDLEIRGAGDLLGAEQSGHVAALGFELYVEMLHEAVAELSGQARPVVRPVRVDARVDAYIPASYVASEALKIDLHRRLALVEHEDELRELRAATEDRYGPLPEPVDNLFAIQEAKLKLVLVGADYLVYRGGRATVGPVALGSAEVRALRGVVDTAVYTSAKREVAVRAEGLEGALALADAIVDARRAA